LHAFEDAEMKQGQGEWRLMVQIGCRCPPDKQELVLELVRGFKALEVPPEWRPQLVGVGGGLGGEGGGGGSQNAEAAAEAVRARASCEQLLVME
jgi:hypothetical protein